MVAFELKTVNNVFLIFYLHQAVEKCGKYTNNNIHETYLSEKCKGLLHSSLECLREITVTLLDGKILVKNLLLVKGKEDAFCSIIKEMSDYIDYQTFQKAVEVRTIEYNAFQECERNLKRFIDLCHRCEDRNILALLPEIIQCSSKGSLFLAIWEKYGKQVVSSIQRALDITEIIEQVWKPAYQEWKTFVKRLKNGDILFREFDSICGRSDQDTLRKEFRILEGAKMLVG
ncbi:unnamed protein product [Mytilus edulis]|uniref:Uncharacterized protein n=1 Tax=Mytilus edulis TaxID=6550 RepID=A0A8S3T800_MYTED|nr:unnamed protein product [Mytilus edulis]